MEKIKQRAGAWRTIERFLSRISDPILENTIRGELRQRAIAEWGYCPDQTETYKDSTPLPDFTPEEQEIYDWIQAYLEYGVDVRTDEDKRRSYVATLNHMIAFIEGGGIYWEIPEEFRCDKLKEIYDSAFEIVFDVTRFENKGEKDGRNFEDIDF